MPNDQRREQAQAQREQQQQLTSLQERVDGLEAQLKHTKRKANQVEKVATWVLQNATKVEELYERFHCDTSVGRK